MGSTCGMRPLLGLYFLEPIFFNTEDSYFLNDSPEERAQFTGISENVGYDMTFKITNSSTKIIINISKIRSASDKSHPNLRDDPAISPEVVTSLRKEKLEAKDDT